MKALKKIQDVRIDIKLNCIVLEEMGWLSYLGNTIAANRRLKFDLSNTAMKSVSC